MPAEVFPPGEFLKDELEARGWTQVEFAEIIDRPPRLINEIIAGKRGITPETAREFAAALGTSPMFWLNLEAAYRLHRAGPAPARISQEARLRERFPVREMIRRGWIEHSDNPDVLESRILKFFRLTAVDAQPGFLYAAKRSRYTEPPSPEQWAWFCRVRQLSESMPSVTYDESGLRAALDKLRALMTAPEEIRHVPRILADCGVRFVIVEPLPRSKVDGVCFWIEEQRSPVIGMSLRLNRIDNFWFVLRHEIEHVLRRDGKKAPMMDDAVSLDSSSSDLPKEEILANGAAAEFCVPQSELEGFYARNNPIYSEQKVVGLSRLLNIHPGVLVGQLQRRTGRYDLLRKYLIKISDQIVSAALTDGFGQSLPAIP